MEQGNNLHVLWMYCVAMLVHLVQMYCVDVLRCHVGASCTNVLFIVFSNTFQVIPLLGFPRVVLIQYRKSDHELELPGWSWLELAP